MSTSIHKLGLPAVVALVLLRLAVGWHFFKEGSEKVQSGKFSSAGFLGSSKGPLAGFYKGMVRDSDGKVRLAMERNSEGQLERDADGNPVPDAKTLDDWDYYRERVANHYGFDGKQQEEAKKASDRRAEQLKYFFRQHGDEIEVYFKAIEAKQNELADPVRQEVASLKGQIGKKAVADTPAEPGRWLAQIDDLWKSYERDLNGLATDEQARRGPLRLPLAGATTLGAEQLDRVLPYFDLVVGLCLIFGLFTRTASVAAALFLGSVIAAQWPGAYDAAPVYYQTVEMFALLVLAATGAGRYAGLDFLISKCCSQCCARKESRRESKA